MSSYLTPSDLAERWKCTPEHVQRLCRSGALAAMRLEGRGWRIKPEAVVDYERRHTAARPEPTVSGSHRTSVSQDRPPAVALDGDYLMVVPGPVPWRSTVLEDRPALSRGSGATKKAALGR